jgi:hypothetical protein
MEKWLQQKLKDWAALPEAERQPGAVKLPQVDTVDPKRAALKPPPGTMIVRVFNRHLGWDKDHSLRHVVAEDYLPGATPAAVERFGMAQNDFMWVPEKEWRSLIPAEPRSGEPVAVPTTFALRLYRFHLDPCRGFSEGAAFLATKADAGRLTLTVQEVTEAKLSMRLEGNVRLQQPGREGPASYEPAILGFLEYDRGKQVFTRFDLLALGTATGLPTDANGVVSPRKGPYPLGIAFELVRHPTPAEYLHPRGARDNPTAYLEPKDR